MRLHDGVIPLVQPKSAARYFCDELEENLEDTTTYSATKVEMATNFASPKDDLNSTFCTPEWINSQLVGRTHRFESPFGRKLLCYADYTASSRSLECIERYIYQRVMPFYANTHTTTSITGLQSTCYRHEVRQIIAQAVNATVTGKNAEDCVLLVGQGATAAVNKLVDLLGLESCSANSSATTRPVILVGPHEHHSNLLPWRETSADVVTIQENKDGLVDLEDLEKQLTKYTSRSLRIGAFSAASNVTGVLTDVDAVTVMLHKHGALAIWDYASAAPYVRMNMNPVECDNAEDRPYLYKDAIFFSGHKFIGGPGSPGVLVVKKRLVRNPVPSSPGGGTVFFVTELDHRYLSNREEREEGGSPDLLGSARLGLAFEIKHRIGTKQIAELEQKHVLKVRRSLDSNVNIVVLGPPTGVRQLPIISFLIRFQERFLHFNYVCALLNDLLGIQSRGGCACAGPYSMRLLGIVKDDIFAIEQALISKKEVLRPGFTRLSFPYFMQNSEVDFILKAVHFIADHGWKFLLQYRFNHKSGEWKHVSRFSKHCERKWLSHFFSDPALSSVSLDLVDEIDVASEFEKAVNAANDLADDCVRLARQSPITPSAAWMLDESYESLRWFVYPFEVGCLLRERDCETPALRSLIGPIQPDRYHARSLHAQWELDDLVNLEPKVGSGPEQSIPKTSLCKTNGITGESERLQGGKYPLRLRNDAKSNQIAFLRVNEAIVAITKTMSAATLFPKPPKKILHSVGEAILQWKMIQNGDRLLLGVSGGKDSLSLLHILLHLQKRAPIEFDLACATVDPQTASYDPSPLKDYMKALGVEYHYLSENIMERAKCELNGSSICSYCSRMKRGLLYQCCRTNGFNKLVLGQHLDDIAESFVMSLFHNGQLRTMKANYWNDARNIQIIRPLIYVREFLLQKFASDARLPVINENCPACFEQPKERARVKKLLAQEETLLPQLFHCIRRALVPLLDDHVYGSLNQTRDRILSTVKESCVRDNK
uniref:Unnamed protein product putative n=1 Tax=Albugo laibachii Nc14 TaxID=890382 RepID=F0WEJ0_9STRA|nr:unnamed protein product putative [Albugo laibachii Nc14]CCA22872.1 unnamed protein product putative [Albugo laibachii Nc14]|eukprot:CCA22872.1 unnamed protein product putative [Albugo laibachii Nc14]